MWEGRVWCLGSRVTGALKAGGGRGQLRGLHLRNHRNVWVGHGRGAPATNGTGMIQRGTRAREGRVQVPLAPALPHGFEADIPPATQTLTISNAMCQPRVSPAPGNGIPSGPKSLWGLGHVCTTTGKLALPEPLPCDHKDPTRSPWYGNCPELGSITPCPHNTTGWPALVSATQGGTRQPRPKQSVSGRTLHEGNLEQAPPPAP